MGRTYVQLTFEDRCEIAKRTAKGQSVRKVAAALDRAPSSISREVKRNSGRQIGYKPEYANDQTKSPAAWRAKVPPSASATKPSIALLSPRLRAPRISPGAIFFLAQKTNAAGEA